MERERKHTPSALSLPAPAQPCLSVLLFPSSQLIDFYSECLRRLHPGTITILDAAAAHLARSDGGGAAAIAQPLQLATTPSILIPLNDADPRTPRPPNGAAVGSHWSLLAFHRPSWSWRHFDSAPGGGGGGGGSAAAAQGLVRALGPWLGGGGGGDAPPLCTGPPAPAQANGSDCGLHACLSARAVAGVLSGGGGANGDGDLWPAADAAVAAAATPAAAAAASGVLKECIEAAVEAGRAAAQEARWVPPGLP